ncbi:hypothetical protein [Streptomyces chrestomyceticus]|uniref:hypothetical protein n=1 Tax=Streptomyces chrestomyceticus TaxID=68185 RepID=UPI0037AB179B
MTAEEHGKTPQQRLGSARELAGELQRTARAVVEESRRLLDAHRQLTQHRDRSIESRRDLLR